MNAETPLRDGILRRHSIRVGENGRMNLPAELRRRLGMTGAGKIMIEEYADRVEIVSLEQRLARVHALMKPYLRPGDSMSEELIRERRAEAAKEEAEARAWERRQRG
jgi:AbrB family looped-hinge helix DNA binding protein